jgi:putative CocE/NonD family hydrolase
VTGVRVDLDVAVPMRDGTVLRADVWRPAARGRYPTLLQRLPYNKRGALAAVVYPGLEPLRAVTAGFAVVIQDCRGRFSSEGTFEPFRHEGDDGADTVDWITSRPFSNGSVGAYGVSYGGTAQLLTAARGPAGLDAVAVQMAGRDPHGWFYEGGAFRLGFALWWAANSFALAEIERRRRSGADVEAATAALDALVRDPWGAYERVPLTSVTELDGIFPAYREWLTNPDPGEYWRDLRAPDAGGPRLPALHVAGWNDIFLRGTLQSHAAMGGRLVIGPWAHAAPYDAVGECEYGPDASQGAIDVAGLQLRWFARHLSPRHDEPDADPEVRLFVTGVNRWRDESAWPPRHAVETPLYLGSGGRLTLAQPREDDPPDTFVYDPRDPVPTCGGATFLPGLYVAAHGGPREQTAVEARPDVLSFTSEPLEHATEITGDVTLVLFASTSAPDTDWTARIAIVDVAGRSLGIADGILRARYRNPSGAPELLEPGQVAAYTVDVGAIGVVVDAGHRIRLQISSSNFPKYDRNPNHGGDIASAARSDFRQARQTVFHDALRPSHLVLPFMR